ncbi:MAG: tRNA uridine-5-carboxymethylaminomethyl(34) synthesis GTPase MnmE [Cyclobacteriaceae bacterium]
MSLFLREDFDDTIVALATPPGIGALGIVRLSGKEALNIANAVFHGKDLRQQASHTLHFGTIRDGETIIDEVLASVFIAPRSFTKENMVEFSCHGSPFILQQVVKLLMRRGARLARPGEFTKRAFLHGKFDLAQAEAVADLIHADSEAAHFAAINQMRGGFSNKIKALREELIHFASMIELELDFGEEDVEFADRQQLKTLVLKIYKAVEELILSFDLGNVIKNGVPAVIAGKPNAGKSTLLNALLNEEKSIVSDIPGTTRDVIEDEIHIEGVLFRFIDTAGLRESTDHIEKIGIKRTREKMKQASLIIYMFDLQQESLEDIQQQSEMLDLLAIPYLKVGNKMDLAPAGLADTLQTAHDMVLISASQRENLDQLKARIIEVSNLKQFKTGDTMVTNLRHFESLKNTRASLEDVLKGLDSQVTNDFLALDLRQSLHHLGEITGEITTDDLLANIFSKFCIGK